MDAFLPLWRKESAFENELFSSVFFFEVGVFGTVKVFCTLQ
jgi:hypothetical protein